MSKKKLKFLTENELGQISGGVATADADAGVSDADAGYADADSGYVDADSGAVDADASVGG